VTSLNSIYTTESVTGGQCERDLRLPSKRNSTASARYSYPSRLGLTGCVCLSGWLHTKAVYPRTVDHLGTNRARRRVTSLMRRTPWPIPGIRVNGRRTTAFGWYDHRYRRRCRRHNVVICMATISGRSVARDRTALASRLQMTSSSLTSSPSLRQQWARHRRRRLYDESAREMRVTTGRVSSTPRTFWHPRQDAISCLIASVAAAALSSSTSVFALHDCLYACTMIPTGLYVLIGLFKKISGCVACIA